LKPQVFSKFFTLKTPTEAQTTFYNVAFDDLEPGQLTGAKRDLARSIFGAVESIPPAARRVVVMAKGRDVGGTRAAAERTVHLGTTARLERTGPDELVYVFFGGPKLRHARVGLRFARAAAQRHGLTIIDDSSDGFTIVRHDGRKVRFECFAASRGGDNIRGVPILAAVLTEAAFYYDEASGVMNGETIFAAIFPRLLPGGQVIIESTVWAESGLLFTEFTRNFGAPVTALAALCPTGLMRDDAETQAMIAAERERDPENAARELDVQFMPMGSGHFFDRFAVGRSAVDSVPIVTLPPHGGWLITAGYDPAYVRDAAEGAVVSSNGQRFEVIELFMRIPAKGKPLVPSEVDREFAEMVAKHGGRWIATDQHYQESVREHVAEVGIGLLNVPGGNAGKCEVFSRSRELIHVDQVRWSEGHHRLTRQVREVVGKPLPGGLISISSPRKRGDHGDAAHALCLALWAASFPQQEPFDYGARSDEVSRQIYGDSAGERSSRFWGAGPDDVGGSSLQMNLDEREVMQRLARKYSR
jgi:hypothetical protein